MRRVNGKAMGLADVARQPRQNARGELEDSSTSLADQMSVDLIGDLVHGGTVAEVDVIDDAQFLEGCQVSVDG